MAANKGSIFLDEIGEIAPAIQAKLLRVIQEREIQRVGGDRPVGVDVRILAATNRDLEAAVAEGRLREDLYYRLKVVTVTLPPLREREGDVPRLAAHFLTRLSREMDMQNPGLTPEAQDVLAAHPWPGNVRELGNALKKALIFSRGCPIGAEEMRQAIGTRGQGAGAVRSQQEQSPTTGEDPLRAFIRRALMDEAGNAAFEHVLDAVAKSTIAEALEITGGNRTRAAKLLGLSRPTLIAKIEKYGLKVITQVQ